MAGRGVAKTLDPAGAVFVDHDILDQTLAVALQILTDRLIFLAMRRDGLEHGIRCGEGSGKVAVAAAQTNVSADRCTVALGEGSAEERGFLNEGRDLVALDHILQCAQCADIDLAVLLGNGVKIEAGNVNEVLALGSAAETEIIRTAGKVDCRIGVFLAKIYGFLRCLGMVDHCVSSLFLFFDFHAEAR